MKQTKLAFIIALGLVAPSLAYSAHSTDHENAVYEHDFPGWNSTSQDSIILRLATLGIADSANSTDHGNAVYEHDFPGWNSASQNVIATQAAAQKLRFEYNKIYERDSAWNDSGQNTSARLAAQFEYNKIYERDSAWNGFGYSLPKST